MYKKVPSPQELKAMYMSLPQKAKDIYFSTSGEECELTAEMYGIEDKGTLANLVGYIMIKYIALHELPKAIEIDAKVTRRVALQAAIRVSRHILKDYSQYTNIGNVDAYIEEWNKELRQIQNSVNSLKGGVNMSRRLEEVQVDFEGQPHCATILLLDTSGSMAGDKIDALNEGLRNFKTSVENDDLAKMRVDLAVATFNDRVDVVHNFSSIENFEPLTLSAGGYTSMGDAILKAAEMIEERKQLYKQKGIDYYRPWIFMITDGDPTDMKPGDSKWENVIRTAHDGEKNKKFMFFAVAVDPANTEILSQIAPPNREPVRLKGLAFNKLFEWLSRSLGSGGVSGSTPGEQVPLQNPTGPDGWAYV